MDDKVIMSRFFDNHKSIHLYEISSKMDYILTIIDICYENIHEYKQINEAILSECNIIYQILTYFYENYKKILYFLTMDSNSKIIYESKWLINEDGIDNCLENFQWMLFTENYETLNLHNWLKNNKDHKNLFREVI